MGNAPWFSTDIHVKGNAPWFSTDIHVMGNAPWFSTDIYCSLNKISRAHEKTEEIDHCTQHVGRT